MLRLVVGLLVAIACVCAARSGTAMRTIGDVFNETYAGTNAAPEFRKLVKEEAKCQVCHIVKQNRNKRNPYGAALHEALKEAKFPMDEFKKTPKNKELVATLKDVMKKLEEMKSPASADKAQTYGERIKAGLLPGGDKDGK